MSAVRLSARRALSALRALASLTAAALVVAGLVAAGPSSTARADSAPADPSTPTTVSADALPTVQINGVAWSQTVVAGTVYVAGQFTTARPAGAAPGTSTVTRSNLLAYDLATGTLIPSFAPALNGPAYVVAGSLDGTRLYVGGDFTTVNGAAQNRFVVLNRTTGQRIAGFNPNPNSAVRAIASTPSTIYLGGKFTAMGAVARPRLAAVSASTGALLSWTVAVASAQVDAMVLSPDNTRLIVAGRFDRLNGVSAKGSGAVSTSTGAVLPWAANAIVQDSGLDSGITSLSTDGTLVFGTGFVVYARGGLGNLEGTFAANVMTGALAWVADCHGDSYSTYANPGKDHLYVSGHGYYCGNLGAFPESTPRLSHYGMAFSKRDVTTMTPDWHPLYTSWAGRRAPANLNFYPEFTPGTFTGQGQATWSVTGAGDYVVFGGEFPSVNGVGQQGLVRMASAAVAPNLSGPQRSGAALAPAATSRAAGTAQVSWPTNWDRDNETLTYRVFRDGGATPVYTTTAQSTFWQLPRLAFTDTGLAAGRAYRYVVVASDPFGNSVASPSASVTVAGAAAGALSAYARAVLDDRPAAYWRLGEAGGAAQDWTGFADSAVGANVTRGVAGALAGDPDGAARFAGNPGSRIWGTAPAPGSNRFSVEAWFTTTSTTGGKVIGFGNAPTGDSVTYDRHVYLGADGRLRFGVDPHSLRVITSAAAYNDGAWHHVVATLGAAGMTLYVDGALVAQDPATISAAILDGYWRVGGDTLGAWPGAGAADFRGDIDDVAVYGRALTAAEVAAHYAAGTGGSVAPNPRVASDEFGRTVAAGFGAADLGGPWTATAGATSVSAGAGRLALAGASSTAGARLPGATGTSLTTQVTETWDRRPTGSGGWFLVRGRITAGGEYRLKLGHKSTGAVTGRVVRTDAAGVETAITAEVTVPGVTYAAGAGVTALFEVSGTTTTTLRAKVWPAAGTQPAAWFVDAVDATAALQGTGHTGIAALTSSTATNGPAGVAVDGFSVTRAN